MRYLYNNGHNRKPFKVSRRDRRDAPAIATYHAITGIPTLPELVKQVEEEYDRRLMYSMLHDTLFEY